MEKQDVDLLLLFTLRIGMYTYAETEDNIVSFLHGYESGRVDRCDFINQLSKLIEEENRIEPRATGWWGQISRTAEKLGADWVTVFKKYSLKLLTKHMDADSMQRFLDSMEKRMFGKMAGVKHHFRKDWLTDWYAIVQLDQTWFQGLFTSKELSMIQAIEHELKHFEPVTELPDEIEPTAQLITRCEDLQAEMQKKRDAQKL